MIYGLDEKVIYKAAQEGEMFLEGDLVGVRDAKGNVVVPARYGYIGWRETELVLATCDSETCSLDYINSEGRHSRGSWDSNGLYMEKGRFGLNDGRAEIPPMYDEILPWSSMTEAEADVYYVRQGNKGWYVNHLGVRILTAYRRFDGRDDIEPYYVDERESPDVLMLMELAGDRRDAQTCFVFGEWVRLDRLRRDEIRGILSRPDDLRRIPDGDVEKFYSPFTYIYSAYKATSRAEQPIADCIDQFRRMECFESTGRVYLVLSVGRGTEVDSLDTEEIDLFFSGMRSESESRVYSLGIRVDETLTCGEVSMFCLFSFSDYWPMKEESKFDNSLKSFDKDKVLETHELLMNAIADVGKAKGKNVEMALRRSAETWGEIPADCPDGKTTAEIEDFCDFLLSKGASIKSLVCRACWDLPFGRSLTQSQIEGRATLLRWAVRNGADINHIEHGMTGLDHLLRALSDANEKDEPKELHRREHLLLLRDCMIELGGKTSREVLQNYQKRSVLDGRLLGVISVMQAMV